MRKILLATTVAICAGGVASAQGVSLTSEDKLGVSLTGEGKLGLRYVKDAAQEWSTISSAKVTFSLSGKTDNYLIGKFGGSFSLDAGDTVNLTRTTTNSNGDTIGTLANPFTVYVGSADGPLGKIEAGSDLAAADKKSGGLNDPGLGTAGNNGIGLDNIAEAYYGGSGKSIRYEKAIAGAAIAISADLDDSWAIGGEYAISEQFTIGAGYDRSEVTRPGTSAQIDNLNTLSFGAIASLGSIEGRFIYSARETTVPTGQQAVPDKNAYGLEVSYILGETTFMATYAKNEGVGASVVGASTVPAKAERDGWGVGVSHKLGGGVSFEGAFGNVNDNTVADLGFLMKF